MELAINPTKIISPLCYSIFRLEPYTNCPYSCRYCYARWYRSGDIKPRFKALGMFSKVAKKLDIRIPFRLATLSEPLQDAEERFKLSFKLMKTAKKFEIPIILCTKSDRIAKEPWKSLINSMAEDNLIVVQISVSSLDRNELELRAPQPERRLEALNAVDAPKVLRLQPLIPNYSFSNAEEFVERVKDFGIDQITTEPLRIERNEIEFYSRFWQKWSSYSFEGDLIKVDVLEVLKELREACGKYKIEFGLCKEGYFDLETANCCGMHYLDVEIRPTLRELYKELVKAGKIELDRVPEIFGRYLFGEKVKELPRPIRKALKYHEKVLLKVLRDEQTLRHLTPLIRLENSILILVNTKYLSDT